jgi:hypothetical protein
MPRRLPHLCVTLLAVLAAPALGEDGPRVPNGSISLSGGVAARTFTFAPDTAPQGRVQPTTAGGFSPTVLRLRGEGWLLPFLGAELDASADLFATRANQPRAGPELTREQLATYDRSHQRVDVRGALAGRLVTRFGLVLSASVGFAVSRAPYLTYTADGSLSRGFALTSLGPTARLGVALYLERLELAGGVVAVFGVLGERVSSFEPTAFVGWRVADLDTLGLTLGADYGALLEPTSGGGYSGTAHRITLALKLSFLPPRPPRPVVEPRRAPTTVRVQVVTEGGSAAAGALVSVDGATAEAADASGARVVEVTPGAHELKVTLAGHRPSAAAFTAVAGSEAQVRVVVAPLSGPGRLSGVVRAAAGQKPLPGATVTAGEATAQTDAAGTYRFDAAGPGPVKVRVEAQGFTPADEVAQVPPEGEATLDVALEPLGKGSPATVRGLVRARTGEAVKATVVIKGRAAKVPVTAEGRFVVTIPAGEYFFVISAPGYVSQTKKVTLADGDQAIFHCELQKVTK